MAKSSCGFTRTWCSGLNGEINVPMVSVKDPRLILQGVNGKNESTCQVTPVHPSEVSGSQVSGHDLGPFDGTCLQL